ncbi:Immunoglobulin-binding protein 1 [Aphelenchoides bicaudatus]|nr:Immunoglobulin-binding protein 1 [Aphelenchoides bicaudatus]
MPSGDHLQMDDNDSLAEKFKKVESVITDLNEGTREIAKETVEECLRQLKSMKSIVEQMDLMSSNESIDDMPTSSLQYLLIEAYLAFAAENSNVPVEKRFLLLQESQKFYNEFLLNSDIFGFNPLPSGTFRKDNDEAPSLAKDSRLRQRKLDVLNMQDGLAADIKRLQLESERGDDESVQRELAMKKLQLWCIRSITNLEHISRELQMLEHRSQVGSSAQPPDDGKKQPS